MITRLRLTNFKAWKELKIRFATVTGIFGANSAGKSSLIQFLLLLKQTRDATDRRIVLDFGGPESLANLGSFPEVVHGHHTTAEISWELTWTLTRPLKISGQSADAQPVEFAGRKMDTHCTVGLSDPNRSSTLFTRSLTYLFGDYSFALASGEGKRGAYDLNISSQRGCGEMTARAVVDTNVLVVANGRDTHVDVSCQLRCVDELARLSREEVVCVDDKMLIMSEYEKNTGHKGQAKPGTVFYKQIWRKMGDSNRVRLVPVEPRDAEGRDFADPILPPSNLKKDAKFLAVAIKADAVIVNAADSDWAEHRELTGRLGVDVRQLCPQHATRS